MYTFPMRRQLSLILLGNKKPNPDPWNTVPMNSNLRKKEEKIKRKEKEKETTKANMPIAQNTQFY